MTPLVIAAVAGCLAVSPGADRILARDLLPVWPEIASVGPETPVAFAPAPGVSRFFRAPDLRRLATRFHLDGIPESPICFERRVAPLSPERLLAAMRSQLPEARIEILETTRAAVPEGEPEFPLAGLRHSGGGETWNGFIRYAGNRRFFIWARVKVRVSAAFVVAAEDIAAGRPVTTAQLRVETRDEFPASGTVVSVAGVEGKVLRRAVAAGTVLRSEWLDAIKDVTRGETVKVEVHSGNARLEFEAQAEASGVAGQTVPVVNPVSKKRFKARVEGKGRVSVGTGKGAS
jgi:flagella basal body P-ring formation protein FlgA